MIDGELKNARAPCLSGESIEELFYCEDRFIAAMYTLGKDPDQHFDEWEDIVADTSKDVWLEIINECDPEDDGADFSRDEDGFIKAMEQHLFWYCSDTTHS